MNKISDLDLKRKLALQLAPGFEGLKTGHKFSKKYNLSLAAAMTKFV
jgi:hypothetical protein